MNKLTLKKLINTTGSPFVLVAVITMMVLPTSHALTVNDSGSESQLSLTDKALSEKNDLKAGNTLNELLSGLTNMRSDFYQRVTTADGELIEESSGTFYLSKPGRFRWNYVPEEGSEKGNVITSNGETLSMYDADLETLSARKLDQMFEQVPSLVLVREDVDVSELFRVKKLSKSDGNEWFELLPLSKEVTYDYLQIALKGDDLAAMKVKDLSGQLITVSFDQLDTSVSLKSDFFDFDAPEGTDILSQ